MSAADREAVIAAVLTAHVLRECAHHSRGSSMWWSECEGCDWTSPEVMERPTDRAASHRAHVATEVATAVAADGEGTGLPTDPAELARALDHDYTGGCPDTVEGWDSRDPDCGACRLLDALAARAAAPAEGGSWPGGGPCTLRSWCGISYAHRHDPSGTVIASVSVQPDVAEATERVRQAHSNIGPYKAAQTAIRDLGDRRADVLEVGRVLSDLREEVVAMYARALLGSPHEAEGGES